MRVALAVSGTNKYFGMPKYFYLLAEHLDRLKVEVNLFIDSNNINMVREFTNVPVFSLKPLVHDNLSTFQFCWNLNKILHKYNFDILHTCHVLPYFYLMNKKRKPVVFQPFGNELFTLEGKGIGKLQCKLGQPILRFCGHHADMLLMEGEFQRKEMTEYYNNLHMGVLPVGIDIALFKQSKPFSHETFSIISVNSLTKYDGMDLLIESFKMFHEVVKDSELNIVGSGEMETQLRTQANGLPVYFFEEIPEKQLIDLYADSDVYVSTSRETDMQMGILEAMAAGLPIISVGQDYMIGGNGKVSSRTPTALQNDLFLVYSGKRDEMAQRSLDLVKQYDFKNIAKKAVEIYRGLM